MPGPIFIVPDHVAGDLLKFPHWSIPDQELDANGHSALVALQKKEDAERKKAEAEAQKSPQQEADAQTAPKGKRSAKQLKVVLAEGASELAAQSIEGQNSGETPESVEARETEERRETLAQVVGSPEQIAEEEASEETEVVETAKAKKKRVRRTKKK